MMTLSSSTLKVKQRIQNVKNLTLEEYFKQSKFICIYNKLASYPQDHQSFVGRLKGVDYLIDYNWKCFQELPEPTACLPLSPSLSRPPVLDSDFEGGNLCRVYRRR